MNSLSLEVFAGAAYDVERTKYEVLGGLQQAREAFDQKRIYPHLGRLVKLHKSLHTVLERSEDFRTPETGEVKGIDPETKELIYEWPELDTDQMEVVKDLIKWALPHVENAIEEGRAVYELVEEKTDVEEVGIVPSYVQEGYMMVPDREKNLVHVLRYNLSIFTDADERYRSLRTEHCKTVQQGTIELPPSTIKMELMEENDELPNPATYFFNTEHAFPYEETMLPVVKRKLMRYLHTESGVA